MKSLIKTLLTYVTHPLAVLKIGKKGKRFVIGRNTQIKGGKKIRVGNNVCIGNNARLMCYTDFAGEKLDAKIVIEDGCYVGHNFTVLSGAPVTLEKNVLIASNVLISSENHSIEPECDIPYKHQKLITTPVSIGENCWIGQNAVILPGVKIGRGSVVGAQSVVTKSVDEYTIVAGNPAKAIKKYNFDTHEWEKI